MTEDQLKAAIIKAHERGDKEAAQLFANKIKEIRAQQQPQQQPQQVQEPQQQERGFFGRVADVFTGADRQTQETQTLKPIGASPELNQLSLQAAKTGLVQTFGSEQSFINRLKDIGANITQDEKGNMIAELPSGRYLVNPPGLDPADVAKTAAQMGAFSTGATLAAPKIINQAVAGGLTSAGVQGIADAAGGGEGVSPDQVLIDAALGGGGQALSNVISGAYRATRPLNQADDAVQAMNFAKQQDLPIMTSDIAPPTTFAGRSAQSMGEKIPYIGTGGAREAQEKVRQTVINELAERYGAPSTDDIMQSLLSNQSTVKRAAGNRMQRIKDQMSGREIPLNSTVKAIDDLIADMTKPGAAYDDSVVATLQGFKDRVTAAPNDLDMLRNNRTFFREAIKGDKPVLAGQADRANQIVYDAMTKDMALGVKATLGDDAARKLRQADSVYASEVSAVKNTQLRNILQKGSDSPELVNNMLFSSKPSDVSRLYRNLDQQGRENARAAVIHRAFQKFGEEESPQKFLTAMRNMKPQIDVMFKGQDKAYIDGLTKYLAATKRASEAAVLSKTGMELIGPAAVFDIMQTGGSATMGAGTIGGLARMYESKPVRELVIRLNNAAPGSKEFDILSRELTQLLTSMAQSETE